MRNWLNNLRPLNLKACRPIPLFYRWEHSGEVKSRMVNSFHLIYYSLDWEVGLGVLNWKGPEAVHGLGGESWFSRDVCQDLRLRLRLRGRLSACDPEPGARGLTEAPTSRGEDLLPPWGPGPLLGALQQKPSHWALGIPAGEQRCFGGRSANFKRMHHLAFNICMYPFLQ